MAGASRQWASEDPGGIVVPIGGGPSEVERFRGTTGLSAPLGEDPKIRPISMNEHPMTILYNTATKVHSIAAVGAVPLCESSGGEARVRERKAGTS